MPTFKCSQCKQHKDEGEYDSDRHGVLGKSCRACLVCCFILLNIENNANSGNTY